MYCQKCGYKVKNGSENCGNCGAEVLAEFCGGFWDILEAPAPVAGAQERGAASADAEMRAKKREEELKEKAARREQELLKQFRIRIIALGALCGLLLIGCIIQTIRLSSADARIRANGEAQIQSSQMPEGEEQGDQQKKADQLKEEESHVKEDEEKLTEDKGETEKTPASEMETEKENVKEDEKENSKESEKENSKESEKDSSKESEKDSSEQSDKDSSKESGKKSADVL